MPIEPRFNVTVCTLGQNPNLWNIVKDFVSIITNFDSESILTIVFNGQVSLPSTEIERVRFFLEPKMGYATVRNRALEVNPNGFNLVFIDDDETISLEWLINLRRGHINFPTAILAGPVEPLNEHVYSYRRSTANRFSANQYGALMVKAPSCNLLIPNIVAKSELCYFDEFFNRGGEDTDLTYRLTTSGFEIRWISDAKIYEIEDASRLSREWLAKRQVRDSLNHTLAYKRNHTSFQNFNFLMKLSRNLLASSIFALLSSRFQVKVVSNFRAIISLLTGKFQGLP
jgi:hypothetical protein